MKNLRWNGLFVALTMLAPACGSSGNGPDIPDVPDYGGSRPPSGAAGDGGARSDADLGADADFGSDAQSSDAGSDGGDSLAGSLDPTFGDHGELVIIPPAAPNWTALTSDGRVIVESGNGSDFVLGRYLGNGTIDTSFGASGTATTDIGGHADYARTAAFQSDGKMIVGGECSNGIRWMFCMARYQPDGALDTSFDTDGKVITYIPLDSEVDALALESTGKIVAAGTLKPSLISSTVIWTTARYTPAGSLDTSFDSDGIVNVDLGSLQGLPKSVVVQSDGKVILGGYLSASGASATSMALFRLAANGALDSTFGSGGQVLLDPGVGTNVAQALVLQADGKILVAGSGLAGSAGIVRLNPNGGLDPSYGTGGRVMNLPNATWKAAALQADGKLIVVGFDASGATFDFSIARITTNGQPDPTFGTQGYVRTDFAGGHDEADSVRITASGKLLVTGRDFIRNQVLAAQYRL